MITTWKLCFNLWTGLMGRRGPIMWLWSGRTPRWFSRLKTAGRRTGYGDSAAWNLSSRPRKNLTVLKPLPKTFTGIRSICWNPTIRGDLSSKSPICSTLFSPKTTSSFLEILVQTAGGGLATSIERHIHRQPAWSQKQYRRPGVENGREASQDNALLPA